MKFLALLTALCFVLAGCGKTEPPPTNEQQVASLVAELSGSDLVIDQVEENGKMRDNAHSEPETETKKRKVTSRDRTGKTTTKYVDVKKNDIVAEVTVVVSGNCKAQIERVLNVGSTSHYFDETWNQSGVEVDVDPESEFSFMPNKGTLEKYFSTDSRVQDFAFCRGKAKQPSPPGRD